MNSFLDRFNLSPTERRFVVIVAIVVFAALNVWFVWPEFGSVSRWERRQHDAEVTLTKFQTEVARKPVYESLYKDLSSRGGSVATEEQALRFQQEINSQALLSGVGVQRYDPTQRGPSLGRTNFFEEQTMVITVTTGEKELIDFLYNLGSKNSLIRVRSMSLQPDPSRMKLVGSITLVESFQKKQPTKLSAATAAGATAVKATNQPVKTNQPAKTTNQPVKTNPAAATNPPSIKPASQPVKPANLPPKGTNSPVKSSQKPPK